MKRLKFSFRTKTLLAYSFSLFTLLTAFACQQPSASPTPDSATVSADEYRAMRVSFSALEGEWLLTTYQNAPLPQHLQNKSWLRLEKQSADALRLVGTSFVNGYGGTARLDESKGLIIVTDGIVQQLVASTNDELNKAEVRYFDELGKARTFELTDTGQLKIYAGEKGNPATEVLVFTKK